MQLKLVSTAAILVLASSSAFAHKDVEGTVEGSGGSYLTDGDGNVVLSGSNDCVHTGNFSDDDIINICEGIVDEPAPVQKAVEAPPPPPAAPEYEKVVLNGRALFAFDSAQLSASGEQAMQNLINKLRSYSQIDDIIIEGHTDSIGSEAYNLGLSQRRADTIKGYLQPAFPDVPMTATGVGEANPVASNDTAEGRQRNRRVEIRVDAETEVQ